MRVLDERVERKREIFEYYRNALGDMPGIEFMPEPEWSRSNRWLTAVLITPEEFRANWEVVRVALGKENIDARPVWKAMQLQPVSNPQITPVPSAGATGQAQIITDSKRGLCLPSGTAMTEEDLDRVISVFLSWKR